MAGKRYAYYDQEKREGTSWGEPDRRQALLKVDGRLRRLYEDGSTAAGILSPIVEKQGVEIGSIATQVQIIEDPETDDAGTAEAANASEQREAA